MFDTDPFSREGDHSVIPAANSIVADAMFDGSIVFFLVPEYILST